MNIASFLKISTALPVAAMLALAGCGGGSNGTATGPGGNGSGGGSDDDPPVMAKPASPAPPAGVTTNGLTPSAAERTVATGSTTLAALFSAQPANVYSPVSGALKRDFEADTASLDGVLHVHTVQRTSAGGYLIHYTDGIAPRLLSIEFDPGDCRPGYCETRENGYHGLWAWTSADGEPLGSPGFSHMHALNLIANPTGNEESRIAFVFGLTTPPATLQNLGKAVYNGYFRTDAYRMGNSDRDLRQRYHGNLRIVANFDMSHLNGTMLGVHGSEPGSDTRNPLPTSSFLISDGEIHDNGQFTATLTGMDSDDSVADKDSVRGVMGRILGEFYGPEGSMIGGAVTASRDLDGDDNDLTFSGYFRGEKLGPTASLAADAFAAGIDRDLQASQSELLDDDGMARVERTASGWSVTVGDEMVAFSDTDYGASAVFSRIYWRDLGNDRSASLWTETGGFGSLEFDHFDVKGWSYITWNPGADPATADFETEATGATLAYVLHGNRTPAGTVPTTGSAEYTGRMAARDYPTDDAVSSRGPEATFYRGDATLTADFASSSVVGSLSNLQSRPGDDSTYSDVRGDLTFNAAINGNGFTATSVTGTGDIAGYGSGSVRGAFFGPAAAEAGGVFDASDSGNNRAMVGWFGGDKE